MTVELEKSVAENLINFKLRTVKQYIQDILRRWNEENAVVFLEKTADGLLEEAENDAIDLKQLLSDESELQELMNRL